LPATDGYSVTGPGERGEAGENRYSLDDEESCREQQQKVSEP
jgi:hypothetical protein